MREISKNQQFTSYVNVNIFQYKNSSPIYQPGNFLNHKIWNLEDNTDVNKKFNIQYKGHPLSKTTFIVN